MQRSFNPVIFFLLLTIAACRTSTPTSIIIPATPVVIATLTRVVSTSRYGTITVPSVHSSGVTGILTTKDNGNGSTSLSIQLTPPSHLNPWGIYNIGDCASGVPINTRPIFSLADIENGYKEETVETDIYKSTPGNLIIVIYGISPDGTQQIIACTDLGLPSIDANAPLATLTPDCPPQSDTAPRLDSGTWLAYSADTNSNADIYLINVDSVLQGKSPIIKRLTTNPAADFDPTWSPDGEHIAFRSQRDGNDEIYVMNADGTCQTNLTNEPLADWSPAWSPDGKHIAFARFFDNNSFTDIALINPNGSGLTRLTNAHGEYPDWSPDGTRIAFASARDGNYEIYVMNADGSDQTRLTDNPAYDMSPVWSPAGTQIAFDTQRDHYPPAETGIGPEFEIHRINADGSKDVQLTSNEAEDRFPSWAANGWIAFTSNGGLFIMNADGTRQIKLLSSGTFSAWRPSLSAAP